MSAQVYFVTAFTYRSITGVQIVACSAETEAPECDAKFLLFECPGEWIPETHEEFLEACAYYGHTFEDCEVQWLGIVPF